MAKTPKRPPSARTEVLSCAAMHKRPSIFHQLALPALITGFVLAVGAFILAFTMAPMAQSDAVATAPWEVVPGQWVTNKLLITQKIFYFHMPVAVVSMAALFFTAVYGALFLKTRQQRFDIRARVATEVALVFVLMTMVSGELWERFEWNTWWSWEPRLTTYFILMLLVVGYFVLRTAVVDPEKRAVFASVFGIIAFIDVPICFMITRLVPSGLHPVLSRDDSGLPLTMIIPLLIAVVAFIWIGFGLYQRRVRALELRERVDALKAQLEE